MLFTELCLIFSHANGHNIPNYNNKNNRAGNSLYGPKLLRINNTRNGFLVKRLYIMIPLK